VSFAPRTADDHVTVYAPDLPELAFMGDIPANVEVVRVSLEDGPMPDFAQVDLVIPMRRMREPLFEAMRAPGRLQVVQTLSAGVDWLIGRVPAHVTVCNARGVYDSPLAEWIVGAILAMQRGLVQARDAQAQGTWTEFEAEELDGLRVVIVGFGSIGAAVADRLRPFGVEIVGVARSPRDGALGMADLDAALPGAGVLVDLLPLTSETAGFLDARRLGLLPDGALVVNAGRGRTLDTSALVSELERGRLRAALDVTDPEPLPTGHPLWSLPNVLVSPHVSGDSPGSTRRAFELAGAQIRRFAAGEPLQNVVDRYLLE
jgi:phosphoglycerate dehydrogenase-like enzyme